MSTGEGLARAQEALEAARRRGGALERPLTDAMCALLREDTSAARSVANLLLDVGGSEGALGLGRFSGPVEVFGERKYARRPTRMSFDRRTRKRRFDLLFAEDGVRALAVEVKLDASLADRQLDDLLAADPVELGLDPSTRVGVVVLARAELEVPKRCAQHARFLGVLRWAAIVKELQAIEFTDQRIQTLWAEELFGLYLRRRRFGAVGNTRPSPRDALDAVAAPLRQHAQDRLSDRYAVALEANASHAVIAGRRRAPNIELVLRRRRGPRRERRITIWLEVPRQGRRTATLFYDEREEPIEVPAPAGTGALEALLRHQLDRVFDRLGL